MRPEGTHTLYEEILPDDPLLSIVECFWTLTVDQTIQQRVLPDGCADLLFWFQNSQVVQAFVVGVMTRPHYATLPAGHTLLGVRFHPAMATRFLPAPLYRFNNQILPATGLLENLSDRILKHVSQLTTGLSRVGAVQESLLNYAKRNTAKSMPAHDQPNFLLAAHLGERQRRRLSLEHAGLTPKQLSSILRFRSAVAALRQGHLTLSEVALECGYCDQSHMNRCFRQFANSTPATYMRCIL